MPIWKNEKDNVLMVEMGFGDVIVSSAKLEGKSHDDELVITPTDNPGEVNADAPQFNGKKTDEVKSAVRFVFYKRESILAVMCHLQRILDGWPAASHEAGEPMPCYGNDNYFCDKCDLCQYCGEHRDRHGKPGASHEAGEGRP